MAPSTSNSDKSSGPATAATSTTNLPSNRTGSAFPIVGIGASAGGLEAFTELLRSLPVDTGMAFVLVQHLDPSHESALAHILSKLTPLPLLQVTGPVPIEPNTIYVIAPNTSLSISQGVLIPEPRDAGIGAHRSIDFFLSALAQDRGEQSIGIVLSGSASDGTLGLEAIKAEGGITFAQDDSAQYGSMPQSAIATGCVDFILSPRAIAEELARVAHHPYLTSNASPTASTTDPDTEAEAMCEEPMRNGARRILFLLHKHSGVDFSLYKAKTVQRRIERRMALNQLSSLDEYAKLLRTASGELETLYSDLLINVTSFFRDPEAFETLKQAVFPKLIPDRRDEPVRMWVSGCSTGQEAYSLAIAFAEFSEDSARGHKLQIFATDLNDKLLARARTGLFVKALVQDVSPERLQRFFVEEDGGYRVCKPLRDMVVFARQNVLSDPPFSRMHLVSCRNLLIYLESGLQRKVLPKFHYALKPNGFLFLGASESLGSYADLFDPVDKKHKIFGKKAGPTPLSHLYGGPLGKNNVLDPASQTTGPPERTRSDLTAEHEADRVTLSRHGPPSVLVNADLQVLQFRGDLSLYLKPPTGRANFDLLKMAPSALMLVLRAAFDEARTQSRAVRRAAVPVDRADQALSVDIEIVPLKNLKERCYLIFFEESGKRVDAPPPPPKETASPFDAVDRIDYLERELAETRDYLQAIREQYEAANEELQAANEEVSSSNEELQSSNEELETSKEELESTNEELTTLNQEINHRNDELNLLNSDLVNFQSSAQIPIVLLGRSLAIRRFTEQAGRLFNLLATDIGRSLSGIRHNLDLPNLDGIAAEVIRTVRDQEVQVRDKGGRWYRLHARPYLSLDNKVDGAVLVLIDIDAHKQAEHLAAEARRHSEAIIRTVPDPFVILYADLRLQSANDAFYRTFKLTPAETEGRSILEIDQGAWRIPKLEEVLRDIILRNSFFNEFEVNHHFERIGQRTMLLNARVLDELGAKPKQILLGIRDITEVLAYQAERGRSELRYRRLFETAHDGILTLSTNRTVLNANAAAARMLGYALEELHGKELFEIGLMADKATADTFFDRLQAQGSDPTQQVSVITNSGERREVELTTIHLGGDAEQFAQITLHDVTERMRSESRRILLMAELDHRVKNTLATVQAIARQTGTTAASLDDFRRVFDQRLMALSQTHNLLTREEWQSASLQEIVVTELEPYDSEGSPRVTIAGEEIRLNSRQAIALGLGLHELATNAAKYGALSVPNGRVAVSWDIRISQDEPQVQFNWVETGGPLVEPPSTRGFGSRVIEQGLQSGLEANVQLEFHPEGVRLRLQFPLESTGG